MIQKQLDKKFLKHMDEPIQFQREFHKHKFLLQNNFQYRDDFKDAFDEKELDRIFKKDFKLYNS